VPARPAEDGGTKRSPPAGCERRASLGSELQRILVVAPCSLKPCQSHPGETDQGADQDCRTNHGDVYRRRPPMQAGRQVGHHGSLVTTVPTALKTPSCASLCRSGKAQGSTAVMAAACEPNLHPPALLLPEQARSSSKAMGTPRAPVAVAISDDAGNAVGLLRDERYRAFSNRGTSA
jgi:hypothetical protein